MLRQIHDAVEQKVPAIADPIIKKAQDARTVTSAQADQLRALVQARADQKRPAQDPRALFGDSDVRTVLQDIFKATAQQAPSIAEPIIQKAVDDKKITSAQADQIRSKLKNLSRFRAGPPPFGGPGGPPHWEGRGRFERPQGSAPGTFPRGAPEGRVPGARPAVQLSPA